jgi:4-amino-4-deoxy-L-arabinose transferase-like glycosyltransferase
MRHPAWSILAAAAALKLATHIVAIAVTPYSVHRDELLYLAMGRYLRFLSMDFPPFIAVAAHVGTFLGGESLWGIRVLAALAGTALLGCAGLAVIELGGGRLAMALTMLAMLTAPLFLRSASLFQPVVFDQLWWTIALLALVRLGTRGGRPGDWLLLGAAGGVGLLTKFSIGFIAVGIAAGLLLTPSRRWLATPWPWLAALLALVLGSPSILGQVNLGFPVAGQMADLQAVQLQRVGPFEFLTGQVMMVGPAVLLALYGAVCLWRRSEPEVRAAGVTAVAAVVLLLVLRGKPYYAGPVYPVLLAAGAVGVEALRRHRIVVATGLAALVAAYGAVTLPLGLPVLPPEPMARYATGLGISGAVRTNTGVVLALPQDYADMLGWEEQVAAVAAAYHGLPPDDRARAVLIASNYGEAGAIDWFGRRHGLPRAVAPVGSYWFFGPGDLPGEVAVTLGVHAREVEGFYDEYVEVARIANPWGVPEQRDNPVAVVRGPRRTLQEIWPEFAGRN